MSKKHPGFSVGVFEFWLLLHAVAAAMDFNSESSFANGDSECTRNLPGVGPQGSAVYTALRANFHLRFTYVHHRGLFRDYLRRLTMSQ